jgi:hypothetical protein
MVKNKSSHIILGKLRLKNHILDYLALIHVQCTFLANSI